MSRKIVTSFWAKPIPDRRFDWEAWRDGDEPNDNGWMLVGCGATEQEAREDLERLIQEEAEASMSQEQWEYETERRT